MAAPAIPPPTPLQFATTAQAQAALDAGTLISPALALALLKAQPAAVLRAAYDLLPKSPDGLGVGDPWISGNTLQFVAS
ncbi:hypothetical protein [Methylobacterium sp. 285MFTsu5.1]|uniref:hypothetical protein n=1 Tax=Methylobacterium sp. 285MFTsu5.1 TaxID=1172187 RepID=UPI000368FFB5|nr:hypothetical protein [Methylobacterium sp. 285MFTsu5.1]